MSDTIETSLFSILISQVEDFEVVKLYVSFDGGPLLQWHSGAEHI